MRQTVRIGTRGSALALWQAGWVKTQLERLWPELQAGTRVGTSSLRRQALLLHLHAGLRVEILRGNVETRLRKQREGTVDATVLAAAGLKRLGLTPEHSQVLDAQVFLPAIGQGALGIETRGDDEAAAPVRPLHHQ